MINRVLKFKLPVNLLILYFTFILAGCLLMGAAYLLPTEKMEEKVTESAQLFAWEGPYPSLIYGHADAQLDNYTDALMLLEASHKSDHPFFVAAVLNELPTIGDKTPSEVLSEIYLNGNTEYGLMPYGRYWHGYDIYLKPLLLILNYQQIRYLLMAIQIGLVAAVIALLAYQKLTAYIVPFVGVWLFLNPVSLSLSLQFSPMFILTLAEFIIILWQGGKYEKDRDRWIYHFFIVGCLTSFFDLLTYPLVTLGIPVAYLIVRYCDNLKDCVISFLKATAAWGCGYVLMWSGKWAVGSLISQTNILEQATDSLKFRTGYEFNDVTFTYLDVLLSNLDIKKGFLILVLLIVFTLLCVGFYKKHKFEARHVALLLVGLMPMGWYLAIPNHSYIHRFFTYRELSITVFALLLIAVSVVQGIPPTRKMNRQEWKREEERKKVEQLKAEQRAGRKRRH